MDGCPRGAPIGSATVSAASAIRGCRGLTRPPSGGSQLGVTGWCNLLPSGARLAEIPFVFPVGAHV